MEFIPESEQLFDITARLLSLHSLFAKLGLLKSKTCTEFSIQWCGLYTRMMLLLLFLTASTTRITTLRLIIVQYRRTHIRVDSWADMLGAGVYK